MKVFILSFEFCLNHQYLEKLKEEYILNHILEITTFYNTLYTFNLFQKTIIILSLWNMAGFSSQYYTTEIIFV